MAACEEKSIIELWTNEQFFKDEFKTAVRVAGARARIATLAAWIPVFYRDPTLKVDIMEDPTGPANSRQNARVSRRDHSVIRRVSIRADRAAGWKRRLGYRGSSPETRDTNPSAPGPDDHWKSDGLKVLRCMQRLSRGSRAIRIGTYRSQSDRPPVAQVTNYWSLGPVTSNGCWKWLSSALGICKPAKASAVGL
jgi:hypothetical protein